MICEQCKIEFKNPNKKRRFCSKKCRDESMILPNKLCPTCKLEFNPEKGTQKFCSLNCFNKQAGSTRLIEEPPQENGYRWIPLTQGKFVKIDEKYYASISKYKWCAVKMKGNIWYAKRVQYGQKKPVGIYMHREIFQYEKELDEKMLVDHADGNGLNNTAQNLRAVNPLKNSINRTNKHKQSRFKGVSLLPNGKFYARIGHNYKLKNLGVFKTEDDAARAYDKEARKIYDEFATYNFPKEGERGVNE